jgi:leucyl/phenylalanyl-tRNA--protein transferase
MKAGKPYFLPMFKLNDKIEFPHPKYADDEGFLAFGGDLSPQRLLLAYANGIFPWYNPGDPILWWSPDPRMVLFPANLKVSKSMRQVLRRNYFEIRYDTAFKEVMLACAEVPRPGQEGTWITDEMLEAYLKMHELGFAHSVEAWQDGKLVGGLYGMSLGKCFFGESMFAKVSNASKAAFITMVQKLKSLDFQLIDCQIYTKHLASLGAYEIPRANFLEHLADNSQEPTLRGSWTNFSKE